MTSTWRLTINLLVAVVGAILVWSYWPTFASLPEEWSSNPLYSHGYLVPAFAVALLWFRRDLIPAAPLEPSWWAVVFLLVGSGLRLGAAYFYLVWPDRASLLFMLFAASLALGGRQAFRWTWPSISFLFFMIPFPGSVENLVLNPLQRVATLCSTNVLQTLGFFAQADGNVIVLSEMEMGIVEACSGLRMLSVFMALTVGACFLMQRPAWQKCVIMLSSFLIAVLCNIARISLTGVMYEVADPELAEVVFHDVAGWLMMPLGLLLLLAELKFLDFIFVIDSPQTETSAANAAEVPSLVGQGVSHG